MSVCRTWVLLIVLFGFLPSAGICQVSAQAGSPRPNFIIILADDLGYGDIAPFGSTLNRTPNLERMAKEGRKFTNFYMASAVCSPSRAALMTGSYPKRVNLHTNDGRGPHPFVLFPGDRRGLHPDERTLAEVLKEQGYATGIVGKWHLGDQPEFLPTRQGFDSFFGLPYSNNMTMGQVGSSYPPLPLLRNEVVIEEEPEQALLTQRYTEEAVRFIRAHRNESFFLYLAHTAPHSPHHASAQFRGKSRNSVYGDVVEELDWSAGRIMDALRDLGIDDRTLVLFTSDNGGIRSDTGTDRGSNAPLRGMKASTWEGGMRVPALMTWPGKIPAGTVNDEMILSMDILPTFTKLAGGKLPSDRIIDGKDVWPLIVGRKDAVTPHDRFYYYQMGFLAGVRAGKWKLHVGRLGTQPDEKGFLMEGMLELYDLEKDIGETTNLADRHPEVVKRLRAMLADARKDLGDDQTQVEGKNTRPAGYAEEPRPLTQSSQSSASFAGKIRLTTKASTPDWPMSVQAPGGAPNIVVILLDDIGFGDTSTFGGAAQTPELDRLAAQGLRFVNFNAVGLCSPTRAALLTGRNHHRVGFGVTTRRASGYPGYDSVWKESAASIAEVLRQQGYRTSAFGKWHNTPDWEVNSTGPYDRWPTGRGFEYFYGFMGGPSPGMENQWEPTKLYRNTLAVDAPASAGQGYHVTTDITDEAIQWVAQHQARVPEKPYFLYFAPGAVHSPHHAPRTWIDRYRGQFDQGWDRLRAQIFRRQKHLGVIPKDTQLTPRPREIPAWASLSRNQQKLYARQMEVYAGFIAHTDHEVGRLLQAVRSGPAADNTLVLYIVGDNGAADGSLDGAASGAKTVAEQLQNIDRLGSAEIPFNVYSIGWAWAGNTPFQYWKRVASHFGGVRAPLVVSWPAKIKNVGALRGQFTHVTDVAATLYDVIGISPPSRVDGVEQKPLDGMSFARTFTDAQAPSAHRTQYFEMMGNRALYHDGWVVAARHQGKGQPLPEDTDYTKDRWELYRVSDDFSQARDLAMQYPEKVRQLQLLFDQEARKNDVYPLGAASSAGNPPSTEGRQRFVYLPSEPRVPMAQVPPFSQKSYRMTAEVIIPEAGAQGILVSFGDRVDGFTWYVKEDRLVYEIRASTHRQSITSSTVLPRGKVTLAYEFIRDSAAASSENKNGGTAGTGRLYINDQWAGEEKLPLVEVVLAGALYIGRSAGSPVSDAYAQPYRFTGTLEKVTVGLR